MKRAALALASVHWQAGSSLCHCLASCCNASLAVVSSVVLCSSSEIIVLGVSAAFCEETSGIEKRNENKV